jgi:hypothetical protein
MPAIMSLTTCAQPCRRWANLAAYPVPYRRAVPAQPAPPGRARRSSPAAGRGPPDDHGQADASVGPARPAPASSVRLRLGQTTSRSWIPCGATTPTPAVLAVWLLAASARLTNSPGSDTADVERPDSGRRMPRCPDAQLDTGHRTPTPDSGHPDAGRRSRGHRTRGHWTRGHWTPDTGHRMLLRLTRQGQLRISWATTPSGCPLGRRTVFLRTAPAVLGVPCRLGGEAACQCAKLPIALSDSCSVALPAAKRRLGALLSSDELRVERRAAWWLPSGTCRAGGCVWREVQRVLGGACSGLQRQMRQVRRGDLELRTGDSERGPGRSFHQRVAPGPPCEADPSCTSAPSRPHPSEAAETACQRFARNRLSDSSSWTVTLALPTAGIVWSHHNPLGAPPGR